MGMYSFFEDENIEITDFKGLKLFLEEWKKTGGYNCGEICDDMLRKDKKKYYFTFEDWDDLKLISYWYDSELLFLSLIAQYIEGEVTWRFENYDEAGWVEFKDKKCIIHTGKMSWEEWEPSGEIREKDKIPDNLKKLIILGKL